VLRLRCCRELVGASRWNGAAAGTRLLWRQLLHVEGVDMVGLKCERQLLWLWLQGEERRQQREGGAREGFAAESQEATRFERGQA